MISFECVPIPAEPRTVQQFIDANRSKYIETLNQVRTRVSNALSKLEIYRIYSREERQGGEILKETRKIRLKLNSYYKSRGLSQGSLWEIPDIVGFTVVVSYPSDISEVCRKIDQLVDLGVFGSQTPEKPAESDDDNAVITSKHGRPLMSKGYFACHYNLYEPGISDNQRCICEIQIKTILHDAWGAKTHDLTYKASSHVELSLLRTFELLGDSLAKLDQQSDVAKKAITQQALARQRKKDALLREQVKNHLAFAIESSRFLKEKQEEISALSAGSASDSIDKLVQLCLKEYKSGTSRSGACTLFFLGHLTAIRRIQDRGREALRDWESQVVNYSEKARIAGISGLMSFFVGDTADAIDETERAVEHLLGGVTHNASPDEKAREIRRLHSLHSSLSYYHAEIIGSDVGRKLNSAAEAERHLKRGLSLRRRIKNCPNNAFAKLGVIRRSLRDTEFAPSNFNALDTELFVRAQLAPNVLELNQIRSRMRILNENAPLACEQEAQLLFEFHDYCARVRLLELERLHTGSPSQP
ncbi:hypothetical protein [Albidovulum sediminis]|uniref:RelA/SpoT domain-containing protein n=1 Tax=Albidovulum sediminis TaxID=3066345 RepID=A0ABT2NG70_9RHOB|nr:hypothetical protein [Defluviimonas sediminis]MCT8327918.1 hypothetical protein [Defluviimonas sediminis]